MKVFPLFYFPPISWFSAVYGEKEIALEVNHHYRKQTYANRMEVQGSNKLQTLSIPIQREGDNTPFSHSRINYDSDWRKNHWRTLDAAYRRAPFFEYYEDRIEPFFLQEPDLIAPHTFEIVKVLLDILGMEVEVKLTESYLDSDAYDADYRLAFNARKPISPPWFKPVEYQQVFRTFEADLSILDLIANEGPAAIEVVRNSKIEGVHG